MLGIFLDTETNGLNPHRHAILEIAYRILDVTSGECLLSFESMIRQPQTVWQQSDPGSLKVNGFAWKEVSEGKEKHFVAEAIISQFAQLNIDRKSAVFICQNPSFDRAFFSQLVEPDLQESLGWPYHWLDLASMYWSQSICKGSSPWKMGVSKDRIAATYGIPSEAKPHRAMNGVDHLILCYKAVVGWANESCIEHN